ncbi:sugar ABC transporter permease [soil metagenome]
MLVPTFVVLGVFTIAPIIQSGRLSLFDWDGFTPSREYVGLDNYVELWRSGTLTNSLRVTLIYTIGVSLGSLVAGLGVALLIDHAGRGAGLYRALYFLPAVAATVAVSVVWKLLLDPNRGYVNTFLRGLGIEGPNWLRSSWALPAVMMVGIWRRIGFNTIVFLSGLRTIGDEMYEAATIDGAGTWRRIRHVTIPLLAPITLLVGIMGVIDGFLVFDQVFVMTGGGPAGRTEVVGILLHARAFQYFDIGGASALGVVVFIVIASITGLQWRLFGSGRRGVTQ